MKKRILLRSAIGFPVGVCISNLISLGFAFGFGEYFPCAPQCTALFGSEVTGAAVQLLLSGLLGAVFAGCSVIWEVEHWSLLRATATHFCITTVVFFGVSVLLGWCALNLWGMLFYIGFFFVIYLCIWLSQYFAYKRKIQKINQSLH